jgi:hypothetical protein
MEPWIKRGLLEFGKVTLIFGALMTCYMLIIALCTSIGISPIWGYVAIFVIGALSVTMGTEKLKYDMEKARAALHKEDK